MNGKIMIVAIVMVLVGIFSTATSSIAIECYNKNEGLKKEKESNYNFIIINLVSAVITMLMGFGCIYVGATSF